MYTIPRNIGKILGLRDTERRFWGPFFSLNFIPRKYECQKQIVPETFQGVQRPWLVLLQSNASTVQFAPPTVQFAPPTDYFSPPTFQFASPTVQWAFFPLILFYCYIIPLWHFCLYFYCFCHFGIFHVVLTFLSVEIFILLCFFGFGFLLLLQSSLLLIQKIYEDF